ncbi:hypothetical protein ACVNF4_16535 [Streptomyces sp. S6]
MSRKVPSSVWLAVLLLGALAGVTGLTIDARNNLSKGELAGAASTPSPAATPHRATPPKPHISIPDNPGTGQRVVYSISQKRVWLVGQDGKAVRTFQVWPGTITPPIAGYKISYKRARGTGSDGVYIEHAVYFGTSFAFSHAADGSAPSPDANLRTGAIRERVEDGIAFWDFTKIGMDVYVTR